MSASTNNVFNLIISSLAAGFKKPILLLVCFAATCAPGFASTIAYSLVGTTTQGTAITGVLYYDTIHADFSNYDILAAADPGATFGGFAAQEWTPSNLASGGSRTNNASGLVLINDTGLPGDYLILGFYPVSGAANETVAFGGGDNIQVAGGGCCQTYIAGTITDATPEPATGTIFLLAIPALVCMRRFGAARRASK